MYRDIAKLIMYGDIDEDCILYQMGEIFREFEEGIQSNAVLIRKVYTQIKRLLTVATDFGFDKNLWHNYLAYFLITNENPFSITCEKIGAKMVYISTDYVFPGTGEQFYETDDPTGPLSVYGKTKLGGELAVRQLLQRYFIVRISWVFGKNGNNFVKTMLRLGKERDQVNVVCDQIGSPTYTADLAPLLCDMVMTEKYGIYHATNEGICSWADFAAEIFRQGGCRAKMHPIPSSEYPAKAARPCNSRMSKKSLDEAGFSRLPSWQDALTRYLKEIQD